jgi:hypothetical protein
MSTPLLSALQDPEHHAEHADRRQDRSARVEGMRRVGREGIDEPAAEHDDRRDDRGLEDERGPPADRGGDETPTASSAAPRWHVRTRGPAMRPRSPATSATTTRSTVHWNASPRTYADQNDADYAAFTQAVEEHRIEVERGV